MVRIPYYQNQSQMGGPATIRSEVRASADSFGAQQAQALQQVAKGVGDVAAVVDRVQEEDARAEAQAAFNRADDQARRGVSMFSAQQLGDASYDTKVRFQEDIGGSYDKRAEELSPRAKRLFTEMAEPVKMERLRQIDQHAANEAKKLADLNRTIILDNASQEAGANPGTPEARLAWERAMGAIDTAPGLTDELRKTAKETWVGKTAEFAIDTLSRQDPMAARAYLEKVSPQLSPAAREQLKAKIDERALRIDAKLAIDDINLGLDPLPANPRPDDVVRRGLEYNAAIEARFRDGDINQQQYEAMRAEANARIADGNRLAVVNLSRDTEVWSERVVGAGTVAAANAVIDDAPADLRPVLKGLLARQPWASQTSSGRANELTDPEEINRVSAALVNGIKYKRFSSEGALVSVAASVGLPMSSIKSLQDYYRGGGAVKGLNESDVYSAAKVFDPRFDPKKDPAGAWFLYEQVTKRWPADKDPNPITISEQVRALMWKDAYRGGRTYLESIKAGEDASFTPRIDDAEAVREEMRARGENPDRAYRVGEWDPTMGYTDGVPNVPLSFIDDSDGLLAEREYIMRTYLGGIPSAGGQPMSSADREKLLAEAASWHTRSVIGESAKNQRAELDLLEFADRAKFGEDRGAAAMDKMVVAAAAKSEIPDFVRDYLLASGGLDSYEKRLEAIQSPAERSRFIRETGRGVVARVTSGAR